MRKECFAYYNFNKEGEQIECCLALEEANCKGCPFYKEKDLVNDPITLELLEETKKEVKEQLQEEKEVLE